MSITLDDLDWQRLAAEAFASGQPEDEGSQESLEQRRYRPPIA